MGIVHELQVREVERKLRGLLRSRSFSEKEIVRGVLKKWGRIADFIDTALINHGYWLLTIAISKGSKQLLIKFYRPRKRKGSEGSEWVLKGIVITERIGWGYKWEYDLERDKPIVRTFIKEPNPVTGKFVPY